MTQWYFALCQHPMYLIIEQDETAAERTPPWGEPDIKAYIARIRRNLSALDRYPHLKFNYDFSGVELENLAEHAPDLIERLRHFVQVGRVGFVNGSYAQAHLHGLGSESNLRQMTEGLAAIERIVGVRVRSYAHQEPAIHDQMPQILRALGYRFAVTPGFFWVLSFLTPHEILGVQYQGLRFLHDEEFTQWHGLDGTEIPLYLAQPRLRPKGSVHGSDSHREELRREFVKDLLHYPPIRCDFPDMVDIDDEWIEDHADHEFVVLDHALESRLAESPSRSHTRLYTYWGYGDGINAELLHRTDRSAEAALLEAEGLGALAHALAGRPVDNLRPAWHALLRAQHHDCYWMAGVGLHKKAVGWVVEAQAAAENVIAAATSAIASQINTRAFLKGTLLIVWEPWPVARTDVASVELDLPDSSVANLNVRNADGSEVPSQILAVERKDKGAKVQLLFRADTRGWGYQIVEAAPTSGEASLSGSSFFQNAFYRATLEADGTFSSLRTAKGDVEMIAPGNDGGNTLRVRAPDAWREFVPSGKPVITVGKVAQRVLVEGKIGDVSVIQEILLYHHLPRIDFTLTFNFANTLFGNYWEDESKLNVYWPVAPRGSITHDIPFGVIRGREERPFFPTSWVRLGSEKAGLAVFHRGTNRFWVRGNVLANVLACGIMGRDFGTRAMPQVYIKDYDLRLCGCHVIHYAVYPHDGDWRGANVPAQAFSYRYPLRVTMAREANGSLPSAISLLRLESANLIPTALFARDDAIVCRLFETMGATTQLHTICCDPWRVASVRTLDSESVGVIEPFKIAEVLFQKG
ncbi:MAG: hypothetical protein M1136_02395 [Chloroflexi bacterium]|nr:hypothetical protein [Chloroflexota bacterium]